MGVTLLQMRFSLIKAWLGRTPGATKETILDCAHSLIAEGAV
jgi:hypothetical protein